MLNRRSTLLIFTGDACWISAALIGATLCDIDRRAQTAWQADAAHLSVFFGTLSIWLAALFICGAYERRYITLKRRDLSLTLYGTFAGAAANAGIMFLVPQWHISRLVFLLLVAAIAIGLTALRSLWLVYYRITRLPEFLGVGDPQVLCAIWPEVTRVLRTPQQLRIFSAGHAWTQVDQPHAICCSLPEAQALIKAHKEQLVVLTDGTIASAEAATVLAEASLEGSLVADICAFYERNTGRAPIFRREWGWVFRTKHRSPDTIGQVTKRLLDLIVVIGLLPVAAPLIAIFAAAIRCTSRGPAFFVQSRVGYRGRNFNLVKLRTMRTDAEAISGPMWTGRRDPRVTRLGHFLRKTGIDELPQLWNVLKCEMSLVGPRPERPEIVAQLTENIAPYMQRHAIPAGITGWAQIHRGSDGSLDDVLDKVRLDLYYARNFSVWFDIAILLRTFQMLLAHAKPAPSGRAVIPATSTTEMMQRNTTPESIHHALG
jgi:exopolysaccharide biosynthesis polyprenyl glycosylphosphotransferase